MFIRRRTFALMGAVLSTAGSLIAGCGKPKDDVAASAPSSSSGQATATPTGEVKGTPEQEAAKNRAIQQGPAIEAANEAARTGVPAK